MFSLTYVSNSRNKVNTLSLREKNLKKAMIANNLILPSEFHQLIEVIDKALYITLVMSCENKLIIIILCQITIKN